VNHIRVPVRGSPTRLSTSGQQSYKGWLCRTCCSATSGNNYQSRLRNISEERRSHLHAAELRNHAGKYIWDEKFVRRFQ